MGENRTQGGKRIRILARMVPTGSRVADIGSDHALLPRILLKEGRATFCIATEIDSSGLNRLRSSLGDRRPPGCLELRAGNGLAPLKPSDRLDVIVMAGIGARTQCRILSSPVLGGLGISRLVLQPQGDPAVLRCWLDGNRFRIVEEKLLRLRGQFHLTLAAEQGEGHIPTTETGLTTEDLMAAGPLLVRSGDPVVRKYWELQLKRLLELEANGYGGPGGEQTAQDRKQAERILEALPSDTI